EIFLTHPAGQCSKCHKVDGDGGIAGPDLSNVGLIHDKDYLLQALVAPSAVIAPGYGITLVTLKNGESLGGILMKEDAQEIILSVPGPQSPGQSMQRSVSMSDVANCLPPVSAMPPMGHLLTKSEIRDLIAYLSTLKKRGANRGH